MPNYNKNKELIDLYNDETFKLKITNIYIIRQLERGIYHGYSDDQAVDPQARITPGARKINEWGFIGVNKWDPEEILWNIAKMWAAKELRDWGDKQVEADEVYEAMNGSQTIIQSNYIKNKRISFKTLLSPENDDVDFFTAETVSLNLGSKVPDTDMEALITL